MRILVISQYFPPDGGGGSKRVTNAISGLSQLGHQIEVITGFPHYPHGIIPKYYRRKMLVHETWKGISVIRVWMPSLAHIGLFRRLIMYVSFAISALFALPFTNSFDIIWAANANIFSSLPAVVFSFFKRTPIVRNVDDLWPETAIEEGYLREGLLARLGRLTAKLAYKACKAITPISYGYKRELITKYGIPSGKIHVVEVGVDTNRFCPLKKDIVNFSNNQQLTVMYSGILGTGYHFDYLLDVAKLMKNEKGIQFVIRGFGERKKEIQRKQSHLGNVHICEEFLEFHELIQVLNSADILFLPMKPLPAHEAGLPTKLLEYMALGKPIICSSEGDAADLVQKAGCGFVVSPHSPPDAVKAILALKKDRHLRKLLGRKGRLYVERYLSVEKISRKLERVFSMIKDSGE